MRECDSPVGEVGPQGFSEESSCHGGPDCRKDTGVAVNWSGGEGGRKRKKSVCCEGWVGGGRERIVVTLWFSLHDPGQGLKEKNY